MARRYDLTHMLRNPHNVTTRDLMAVAEERDWSLARTSGSHHIYTNGTHVVAIPQHARLAPGTVRAIIQALIAGG